MVMFSTNWDVDKYKCEHESDEHWGLRRQFMVAHKTKYPEPRLVCLTQVFFNMEFLGCKYPEKTMELVNQLAGEVAEEFRESRKGKLKRTFVGAQDAAGAKAKGSKPPPGSTELNQNRKEPEVGDHPVKKPRLEEDPKESAQDDNEPEDEEEGAAIDTSKLQNTKDLSANLREVGKTFILYIPPRTNSKTEGDAVRILHKNFPANKLTRTFVGSKSEGGWTAEIRLNPLPGTPPSKAKPKHLISSVFAPTQRAGKDYSSALAVENLKKYCTYVEPNPEWFNNGKTPDFIRDRIPCNKSPRTYLIFTKKDTGYITGEVANKLILSFKGSSNDEMFFLDEEISLAEKTQLMNFSQKHKLGFRHFGPGLMLKTHHVCIFKEKPVEEIVEEAKKLGWKHPRFIVHLKDPSTSAKSPPRPNWGT